MTRKTQRSRGIVGVVLSIGLSMASVVSLGDEWPVTDGSMDWILLQPDSSGFVEEFDQQSRFESETTRTKTWAFDGILHVLIKDEWLFANTLLADADGSFTAEIRFQQLLGTEGAAVGIVFGLQDDDEFQVCQVTQEAGCTFQRSLGGGRWEIIGPSGAHEVSMNERGYWNTLRLQASAEELVCWVNGIEVARVTTKHSITGEIGVFAMSRTSEGMVAAIDRFSLTTRSEPVLLEVPYYGSPSGAHPWCVPTATAMLRSYYGNHTQPSDVAADLQTPRDEPSNLLELAFGGAFEMGIRRGLEGLGEALADLVGLGSSHTVEMIPPEITREIDHGNPVYVAASGIPHDFLIVGYQTSGDPADPFLFLHDGTGFLTESVLGLSTSIAAMVRYSDVMESFNKPRELGIGESTAWVLEGRDPSPRAISIYLSEGTEDVSTPDGETYTTSACVFECIDHPGDDLGSLCSPSAWLHFDRGLRWAQQLLEPPNASSTLVLPSTSETSDSIHSWTISFYVNLANSSSSRRNLKVAIVIQREGEVLLNETRDQVSLEPYSLMKSFLGRITSDDLRSEMVDGGDYYLFLVVRDAETGENIDWVTLRIQARE